jgi:hypothetical protein
MAGFLVGALVGLAVGFLFGRSGERARRSYRDYGAAMATVPKARTVAYGEVRRATLTGIVVGAFLIAIFLGAFNYPNP